MTWQVAATMNAVISVGYFAICWTVIGGLVATGQLRTNPLAAATAAIFFTCAVHHGAHTVHMLLPLVGADAARGVALRAAFGWQSAVWDTVGAAVAVYYVSLRRSYGVLLHTPAMFEDEVKRATLARIERERKLLAEAEALAGAGSWNADLLAGTVTWSAGMYRIRNLEPDDAPMTIASAVADTHPDDVARVERLLADAFAGRGVGDVNCRIVLADGRIRHLEGRIRIEHDEAGTAVRMVGMTVDVTERREAEIAREHAERGRKQSEGRIQRSERQLANLLNSAPDAVVIADSDGRIALVNQQTERLFGYERDELLGAPFEKLLPDGRGSARVGATAPGTYIAELGTRPMGLGSELIGRRKDGTEFPVDISLSAVDGDDGRLVTAFVRDITDRKRGQDELTAAHGRALEASRLKSEFVANMSHEIRTPLNGVIGMGGLLLDTKLDPEQREYAEALGASADALMALISDILDFSKIEAGKLELDPHRFGLRELVEGTTSILAAGAHEKQLELIVSVVADAPDGVYGDAGRIRQVLANLMTNAIKFTPAGEIVVRVTVASRTPTSVCVRFDVADSGIGIAPGALGRIFDSFSQADSSTTRRYGGTGLGLAICEQLVALMGGEIGVESEAGAGSNFWFSVPLTMSGDQEPAHRTPDVAGTRVLVVDDNATSRAILQHQLRALEMTCDTADGAAQALRTLRSAAGEDQAYELAVIDSNMPDVNGVELARMIRATPALRSTRLLMLTASVADGQSALRAAVDGIATKPVRESRLATEIARVLHPGTPAQPPPTGRTARPAAAGRHPPGRLTVLVAEDNMVNQLVAARMLEKRGYEVHIAVNGREAVEMHARGRYPLIFMDCQMPELDGYQATAAIRNRENGGRHTRIVAMTANTLKGDRERCLEAGMDDYIAKPLRPRDLEDALTRTLDGADQAPAGAARPDSVPVAALADAARAPLLDPTQLDDTFDTDHDARAKLVALFLEHSRATMAALAGAVEAGDLPAAGRLAHGLKGSAAAVGASRLSTIADHMYQTLAAGTDLATLQAELEHTFEMTSTALT